MKKLKCFMAYVTPGQKICMLLMPFASALASFIYTRVVLFYLGDPMRPEDDLLAMLFAKYVMYLLIVTDIITEHTCFGLSFRRTGSRMEYLKSSPRGISFYRDVLLGSQIARGAYHFVVTLIFWALLFVLLKGQGSLFFENWMFAWSVSYVSAQTGALCVRRFATNSVALAMGTTCAVAVFFLFSLLQFVGDRSFVRTAALSVIALCAGMLLAVYLVRRGVTKRKEEYYDV